MGNEAEGITKIHLQAFGISEYGVRQIFKDLNVQAVRSGFNEYAHSDVKAVVTERLKNPKVKPKTKETLQKFLSWLNGESNIISVDFLRGLSPERKIEVLRARIQELEVQEQKLHEGTTRLVARAQQMIAKRP